MTGIPPCTSGPRHDWQIAIAIRLQSAVSYLRLLELDEHQQQVYEAAYKTGSLEQWVNEHVETIIRQVNYQVAKRDCVVPSVAAHWSEELHARELSGTVTLAGGIKTEVKEYNGQKTL